MINLTGIRKKTFSRNKSRMRAQEILWISLLATVAHVSPSCCLFVHCAADQVWFVPLLVCLRPLSACGEIKGAFYEAKLSNISKLPIKFGVLEGCLKGS